MLLFILSSLLMISTRTISACECGFEGVSSRVFKGTKARANKYPWLAHIRIGYYQCGGSLIDETHVILAAHCVIIDGKTSSPSNIEVYLGRVKAHSNESKPVSVASIWFDSKYDDYHLDHDIAILTLFEPVTYTQTVGPICLPNNESNLTKLIITGWGRTSEVSDLSDDLLETEVDFITNEECNEKQRDYAIRRLGYDKSMRDRITIQEIPESCFCTINKKTHAGVCQGDSGGPIMKKGANGRYYLMGVIAAKMGDCDEDTDDSPSLYTRIFYYKDTIKSIAPNACWQD